MVNHRFMCILSFVAMLLSSCRTSQNLQLHTGTADKIRVSTTIARLQDTTEQLRVQEASIETHPKFSLGIIEFNDEGLSFSRIQRQAVTKLIQEESRDRGAIIVTFIHGWKHNATVCDSNLACFRSILEFLGQREAEGLNRRVIGVYLGWRGLSHCNPVGKQFSIWTRKRIGERLGSNQARRVISDLLLLYNDIKRQHSDTRFVAVGHSLGGGVLFSAVGPMYRQALHDAITEASGPTLERIEGFSDVTGRYLEFPDLTVLVNPAFEAELYKRTPADLAAAKASTKHFSPGQLPLLLSISSEGDNATHFIFPAGQTLKVLFSPTMWLRGWTYLHRNVITAANYRPYITDLATVVQTVPGTAPGKGTQPSNCFTGNFAEVTGGDCACRALTPLAQALRVAGVPSVGARTSGYGNVRLDRLPTVDPKNPFFVVKATREVIKDHGDIFNPTFMSLLIDLVQSVDEEKRRR